VRRSPTSGLATAPANPGAVVGWAWPVSKNAWLIQRIANFFHVLESESVESNVNEFWRAENLARCYHMG
jgi:hypothetical protein